MLALNFKPPFSVDNTNSSSQNVNLCDVFNYCHHLNVLLHSFTNQIFTEHLLGARTILGVENRYEEVGGSPEDNAQEKNFQIVKSV